jgi:Family of unknown function (DUF6152)
MAGVSNREDTMPDRRAFLGTAAAAALLPAIARAHHGWTWAEDEEFSLTGVIRRAELGNPHGLLDVEAADGVWVAEVGQPWRNARAGLTDEMLAPGVELTLEGHRSREPDEKRMKAERIIIAGELYDLYPERS